ncbi:methionine synthase II (cobalamin-independent) [Metarhizium album ARSEF 1941]|uniref:Methionine synthase II (Cobalamin-independent) n=1 Tax=Metarhizium album (strain ARSEF 1941) TaxID=1081103 RepID=A0A0B2WPM8_METAS|nr:methionine synthase II (cobalamin-independent) [Metarhizium album ARSEF 1941]KHN94945.1 methionine synthase II (cobalamin-independent) [Metarhizium album ARSEF 1941]
MPIPTEIVGSLPRPSYLQQAFADFDAGRVSRDELRVAQDRAAKDSIQRLEATGEVLVTDGEQRVSSFATYPLIELRCPPLLQQNGGTDAYPSRTLTGCGLGPNFAADGQMVGVFDDGHSRQLPRLISGPFKYATYAFENLEKSAPYATRGLKQAVISPSMLYLLYPLEGEIEGYPRSAFVRDLVDECEKDIRGCFGAGAQRVSIDFTEGRLALKNDASNPWTGAALLDRFVDLINQVLARFSPEQRRDIGLHTCPGGDCDSTHSAEVPYHQLLASLFNINAGYFLIQVSSEGDRESVYRAIGESIRQDADGVKQVAFVGVVSPINPRIETPEEIAHQLVVASQYIPLDQLGATDDCGFSPFSIDSKPKHGSPDLARDIAFQKIANRVAGARMASERLGI